MRECTIVLKLADDAAFEEGMDYIGADRGALLLAENHIWMVLAIGDFDSCTEEEIERISKSCERMIRLNPIKDDTDSEAAVDEAIRLGYDRIRILGGFGGRVDHMIVNLRLCQKYPGRVILLDESNTCMAYEAGTHVIEKEGYHYVSVFADEPAVISMKGFRYPLDHRRIDASSLFGVSNELIGDNGELTVHEGIVLLIRCSD